jgi:hypothetical protein
MFNYQKRKMCKFSTPQLFMSYTITVNSSKWKLSKSYGVTDLKKTVISTNYNNHNSNIDTLGFKDSMNSAAWRQDVEDIQ